MYPKRIASSSLVACAKSLSLFRLRKCLIACRTRNRFYRMRIIRLIKFYTERYFAPLFRAEIRDSTTLGNRILLRAARLNVRPDHYRVTIVMASLFFRRRRRRRRTQTVEIAPVNAFANFIAGWLSSARCATR